MIGRPGAEMKSLHPGDLGFFMHACMEILKFTSPERSLSVNQVKSESLFSGLCSSMT